VALPGDKEPPESRQSRPGQRLVRRGKRKLLGTGRRANSANGFAAGSTLLVFVSENPASSRSKAKSCSGLFAAVLDGLIENEIESAAGASSLRSPAPLAAWVRSPRPRSSLKQKLLGVDSFAVRWLLGFFRQPADELYQIDRAARRGGEPSLRFWSYKGDGSQVLGIHSLDRSPVRLARANGKVRLRVQPPKLMPNRRQAGVKSLVQLDWMRR
jgi:hypothetical protein